LFATVLPAKSDDTEQLTPSFSVECEGAKRRFLESENPTSEDIKLFFDCFRVDFTYGKTTRINTPAAPMQREGTANPRVDVTKNPVVR